MKILYNIKKLDEFIEVIPLYSQENFSVVPSLSVQDGQPLEGRISLVHNKTGFLIVINAVAEKELFLCGVCQHIQKRFPLLGACQNPASVKTYAKRTQEGKDFNKYIKRVNRTLLS